MFLIQEDPYPAMEPAVFVSVTPLNSITDFHLLHGSNNPHILIQRHKDQQEVGGDLDSESVV